MPSGPGPEGGRLVLAPALQRPPPPAPLWLCMAQPGFQTLPLPERTRGHGESCPAWAGLVKHRLPSCGIPADPPSPSGCATESRQDRILLA